MKNSILIIEDDIKINDLINNLLKNEYTTYQAFNAKDGMSLIYANNIDVIILDLGLPDIDGIEVIENVRRHTTKPIVVVSARSFEADIVKALDLGADDYLVKPFRENELKSRIKTAIRHSISNDILESDMIFKYRNLKIDFNKAEVYVDNNLINITNNEYNIISLLIKNSGNVLTYDFIIRTIWWPYAKEDTSSLRVHMANIRRKIETNPADPKFIITSIGIGYRFNIE